MKLHRQFGHCRPERLGGLLRSAGKLGNWKMNDTEKNLNACQVCEKFGQPSRKPIVSLPHSESFNETISLDIHQIPSDPPKWYVHIIDMYTRFSEAEMISNIMSSTIIDVLNRKWIFAHGAPKKILTDNGGEFDSEFFRQNAEIFNIKVSTTAANSPFSNGCCERHNMILTETLQKVKSDLKSSDDELCIQAAVFAKNSLVSFGLLSFPASIREITQTAMCCRRRVAHFGDS